MALSTATDILNVVAPPISEHEVIQVLLSHDMQGYDGVETLVYRALLRVRYCFSCVLHLLMVPGHSRSWSELTQNQNPRPTSRMKTRKYAYIRIIGQQLESAINSMVNNSLQYLHGTLFSILRQRWRLSDLEIHQHSSIRFPNHQPNHAQQHPLQTDIQAKGHYQQSQDLVLKVLNAASNDR